MLSPAQQTIAQNPSRFRVAICGRRFGKTHLAIRELCRFASRPNQRCFYVAPSYRMAKQIAWTKIKRRLQDLRWARKINESDLTITLVNGSEISLRGAENFDSLRGIGLNFLVMDEFADIAPEAWREVLRPTLSDQRGHALFISTPKGTSNWSYELFMMKLENPAWASWQFTTEAGGRVSEEELLSAQRDLDVRTYRQEYQASFETYAGRIYYAFDREQNVQAFDLPNPELVQEILVGTDFNISPLSTVIAQRQGEVLHVIDEITMYSSNTNELADEIRSRYPRARVTVFPDPAGSARKTSSAGATDHTILANAGFTVRSPRAHTPVRDRINSLNSRLCDSQGQRNIIIHPRCRQVIECLERQTYREGTSQPEKGGDQDYSHMNDALGYLTDYLWPIRRDRPQVKGPQRWGAQIQ